MYPDLDSHASPFLNVKIQIKGFADASTLRFAYHWPAICPYVVPSRVVSCPNVRLPSWIRYSAFFRKEYLEAFGDVPQIFLYEFHDVHHLFVLNGILSDVFLIHMLPSIIGSPSLIVHGDLSGERLGQLLDASVRVLASSFDFADHAVRIMLGLCTGFVDDFLKLGLEEIGQPSHCACDQESNKEQDDV